MWCSIYVTVSPTATVCDKLQRGAVWRSVVQRGAVLCGSVWCSMLLFESRLRSVTCCSVSQCVAVCCSALQCGAVRCWFAHGYTVRNEMMHEHVCRDVSILVTWPIQRCDMTHSNAWHATFTCVTWRIPVFHVWRDSFFLRHDSLANSATSSFRKAV